MSTDRSAAAGRRPTGRRPTGVQSVGKSVDILEILARSGGDLSLSDITAATGQPMPTAHRLVRTLLDRGFLRQLPNRRYALGTELIVLGQAAQASFGSWSATVLQELVDDFGETVNLGVLDGDDLIYIGQSPSPHAMRMFTEIGRRIKPHATGMGKVILAQLPDDQVRGVLHRTGMPPRTPHTITSPEAFVAALHQVRNDGYAIDEEEMELGVRCLAVPLPETRLHLGLSMSGPATRMTPELLERARPRLHEAARRLAAEFAPADGAGSSAPGQEPEPGALALAEFNTLAPTAAARVLLDCCASRRWADVVTEARPYTSVEQLLTLSDQAVTSLSAADVDEALSGHPRIGERAAGEGRDASFSRSEQAAVTDSGEDVQERIRAGNAAYEQRFDRVFLIRAAGRSPEEIVAELTRRLDHDDATEIAEVTEQLRQITHRRLEERIHP